MTTVSERGFTLVELLVALALTVLIGSISYRFLDGALNASESGARILDDLTAIERFWTLLASDLTHAVARPVPLPATGVDSLGGMQQFGERRPAMLSESGAGSSLQAIVQRPGAVLWFTRQGWENPLQQQRSNLQRVVYRFDDGRLWRDYAAERNQLLDEAPAGSLLLIDGVEDLQLRFLARGESPNADQWRIDWPFRSALSAAPEDMNFLLPAAIEVTMRTRQFGDLRRVFLLPGV